MPVRIESARNRKSALTRIGRTQHAGRFNLKFGEAGSGDRNAAKIRASLDGVDLSNSLSAPIRQAIDDLLKIAADTGRLPQMRPCSCAMVGEGGLKFLVAVSELEEAFLKVRIPPGKGIAGLVFSSSSANGGQ
jgi:hypothetical protein